MSADLDLAAIKKRCDEATPGPWRDNSYNFVYDVQDRIMLSIPDHPTDDEFEPDEVQERSAWYNESARNLWFAAHARTDIPLLLERISELTDELVKARIDNSAPVMQAILDGKITAHCNTCDGPAEVREVSC